MRTSSFHAREPELARGILDLKAHLEGDSQLRERVRSKYRTKNTTGYSLNAFLDYDKRGGHLPARPHRRRRHAGIHRRSGARYRSRSSREVHRAVAVSRSLRCGGLHRSVAPGRRKGPGSHGSRVAALRRNPGGNSASIRTLPEGAAGLLVEFQSAQEAERKQLEELARDAVGGLKLHEAATFTHVASEQALALEDSRRHVSHRSDRCARPEPRSSSKMSHFPSSGWPMPRWTSTSSSVKHDYDNAIIFGHAKDGNLHFVITQGFNDQAAVDQYAHFIDDVVELVVNRYDGALKAEHGTGRNMAPFVETEWGSEGYEIMRRLKELADPHSLLNPGVIINSDPRAHLENLKRIPTIEPEVDKCIECGYCESKCPSRELTLTPRQRIVVRREMARLQNERKESFGVSVRRARPRLPLLSARYLRDGWTVRNRLSREHRHRATGEALPPPAANAVRAGVGRSHRQAFRRDRIARALGAARWATPRRP